MADWTDGPEYAPRVRPELFVAPQAQPLSNGPVHTSPGTAVATLERPQFSAPANAPELARLGPKPANTRDPIAAFSVAVTPLTASGLTPEPTSWQPSQPLSVAPVDTAALYPGGKKVTARVNPQAFPSVQDTPWDKPKQKQPKPTFGRFQRLGWFYFTLIAVACLIPGFSTFALALACILGPKAKDARVRIRVLAGSFWVGALAISYGLISTVTANPGMSMVTEIMSIFCMIFSWLVMALSFAVVGQGPVRQQFYPPPAAPPGYRYY